MSYEVNPWMILPFGILLVAIAIMPFIHRHWWERFYPVVAIALGCVTVTYYIFVLGAFQEVAHTAAEYVSFIVLIGSLFVVSGGIHIRISGKSKPFANVILLSIGAAASNVLGTTGASMILIRPFLRVNRYRIRAYHVVFFIFVVSNMGGSLTPIGDPPLFLGYLLGIPFFWVVKNLWVPWILGMGIVLGIFYCIDLVHFNRLPAAVRGGAEAAEESGEVVGLPNILFLAMILIAVFISDPPFLREGIMILAAAASYLTTKKHVHEKNDFDFGPLREVAFLFLGIFATMIPALDWLRTHADTLALGSEGAFFWATGILSACLDNAPTYLTFMNACLGLFAGPDVIDNIAAIVQTGKEGVIGFAGSASGELTNTLVVLREHHLDAVLAGTITEREMGVSHLIANHGNHLRAISISAVFFGAMTYIGNGPNFMVKSIAEKQGLPCPSFFGYLFQYAIPILLPVFVLIWLVFFL
jgi:Na+/H+ antiporter NhaD/arsenite permease-like protein